MISHQLCLARSHDNQSQLTSLSPLWLAFTWITGTDCLHPAQISASWQLNLILCEQRRGNSVYKSVSRMTSLQSSKWGQSAGGFSPVTELSDRLCPFLAQLKITDMNNKFWEILAVFQSLICIFMPKLAALKTVFSPFPLTAAPCCESLLQCGVWWAQY